LTVPVVQTACKSNKSSSVVFALGALCACWNNLRLWNKLCTGDYSVIGDYSIIKDYSNAIRTMSVYAWQQTALEYIDFQAKETYVFVLPRKCGKTTFLNQLPKAAWSAGLGTILFVSAANSLMPDLTNVDVILVDNLLSLTDEQLIKLKAMNGKVIIVCMLTPTDTLMEWKDGVNAFTSNSYKQYQATVCECLSGALNEVQTPSRNDRITSIRDSGFNQNAK
jgi:hypothetical protein